MRGEEMVSSTHIIGIGLYLDSLKEGTCEAVDVLVKD
jgi:hypothetical protein